MIVITVMCRVYVVSRWIFARFQKIKQVGPSALQGYCIAP